MIKVWGNYDIQGGFVDIIYKDTITADEFNAIRKSMGWRQHHPEQAQSDIDGNALVIAAYDGDKAIAMAGLRWNGGSFAVMNVLLNPEYQNIGIEQDFSTRIFDFLRSKLKPGFGIQIDINVCAGQETLYENLGFKYSTPENRGIPMFTCLSNQIEITDKMFKQMAYKEE